MSETDCGLRKQQQSSGLSGLIIKSEADCVRLCGSNTSCQTTHPGSFVWAHHSQSQCHPCYPRGICTESPHRPTHFIRGPCDSLPRSFFAFNHRAFSTASIHIPSAIACFFNLSTTSIAAKKHPAFAVCNIAGPPWFNASSAGGGTGGGCGGGWMYDGCCCCWPSSLLLLQCVKSMRVST